MRLKEFMEIQRSGNICNLCNGTFTAENATPSSCQHAFHVECLKTWTEEHKESGCCRCPIDNCPEAYTAIFIRPTPGGIMKEAISLAVDNQCPVCFEKMKPPIASPECCNHYFCLSCLAHWCKVQHACPLDRKNFELMFLHDYIGGPVVDRRVPPPIETPIEPVVEDNTYCEICHSPDDEANLLLCDNCDKGYHTYCLSNPLSEIPEGDWFCPECEPLIRDAEAEQNEIEQVDYRLGGLASDSAEESEGLENFDYDSDDRENLSYMEHFSIRTQEQLARQAMARHRGAGLLRDLIENLENRARAEQRRRRTRPRQNQRRRRVRVEDSVDEFLNAPETANQPELRHEPSTSTGRGGLRRKRRRVLGYDSSGSEAEEGGERAGPSSSQSPDHNAATPHSTPPRKRLRVLDDTVDTSPSPSSIRSRRNLHPTLHRNKNKAPSQHSTTSSLSRSEEEEENEDGSSSYRPTDDSSRDIFASFSTDPNLSSIAEEIHDIASRRKRTTTKPGQMRKRKIRRRRRRTTRKSTGNFTDAGGLVKRARRTLRKSTTRKRKRRKSVTTKKSTKRLQLNSTQRGIKEFMSNVSQSSPIAARKQKNNSRVTISSKLSIFGTDPNYGLVADLENNEEVKQSSTPSTSKGPSQSVSTSSEGYLSRLLAEQDALYQFNTFNMRVNPDNSVSPPSVKILPKVSENKTVEAPRSKLKSSSTPHSMTENDVKNLDGTEQSRKQSAAVPDHQTSSFTPHTFLNGDKKLEEKSSFASKSVLSMTENGVKNLEEARYSGKSSAVGSNHHTNSRSPGESKPGPSTTKNGAKRSEGSWDSTRQSSTPRQSAWTSEAINRVRKFISNYLRIGHPSLTNEETRKELTKRAIAKVIRRTPEKVTDERIKTLIDQYVQFFRTNPLQH